MKTDMTAAQHSLEWPWVEPEDSASAMVSLIQVCGKGLRREVGLGYGWPL